MSVSVGILDDYAHREYTPEDFARAYEASPPVCRAWIKKLTARLFALQPPYGRTAVRKEVDFSQGFQASWLEAPVRTTVLFLDGASSAVQAAAAVLPPVLAGSENVAAVWVDNGPVMPDDILAAMELCGLERVLSLSRKEASEFLELLRAESSARSICLYGGDEASNDRLAVDLRLSEVDRFAVYTEQEGEFDPNVLAWAHPNASFEVHGPAAGSLAEGAFVATGKTWESFASAGTEAAFVALSRIREAAGLFPLVLGPGHEGCFFWPVLDNSIFRRRGLAVWNET